MIKIFADTSDIAQIRRLSEDARISGFTTNPSLMRKAGVTNYRDFLPALLDACAGKPVSCEVTADSPDEMIEQALYLSHISPTISVKIPVVNTAGASMLGVVDRLVKVGVPVNVTAVMTREQIRKAVQILVRADGSSILSIFAGRVGDTGVDPEPLIQAASSYRLFGTKKLAILWASTREVFNITQAERSGADIITVSPELFAKWDHMKGYDLTELSRSTVAQFRLDAVESDLTL